MAFTSFFAQAEITMSATHPGSPVRIQALSKCCSGTDGARIDALRDITLAIHAGELFGVAGGAHAGKSTLLRLMPALELPTSGSVTVGGVELARLNSIALRAARLNIGSVFQQPHLIEQASVYDNVALPLRFAGTLNAPRLAARVQECLDLVDLGAHARAAPAELSEAQRRRVALARALAGRPALLLYDEPVCGHGADDLAALCDILRSVNVRFGTTIVVASRSTQLLGSLCTRVAVLEAGALAEQFAPATTQAPPRTALGRELAYHAAEGVLQASWDRIAHA